MTGRRQSRRRFLATAAAGIAAASSQGIAKRFAVAQTTAAPRIAAKEIFIPARNDTGVFPGFVTYIHKTDPVLLHRSGWVDESDTYDDFHDIISEDNGVTWTAPKLAQKSVPVEDGLMRYVENGAFFDPDRGKLLTVVSTMFYPGGHFSQEQPRKVELRFADPFAPTPPAPDILDFGFPSGISVSFCFPIKTAKGRIVIPCFRACTDDNGKILINPKSRSAVYEARMMLGEEDAGGAMTWSIGEAVPMDQERTSRGFSESMPVELRDGRLALLCRGSNAGMEDVPGAKWLSFSEDGGRTWTPAKPLTCTDGEPIESSATGGACFRSEKTGKLYFMGNLCASGERAKGNWPRSPLHIAEIHEDTFALKRDTIAILDQRAPEDTSVTQLSNFRFYQDRATGDIVLFLTRFGENDEKNWKKANYYRYRIALV